MTYYDRLRSMVDAERLTGKAAELLADLEDVREWANATEKLADAIEEAADAVSTWQEAEGREDKAEARTEALEALQGVIDAYEEVEALPAWAEIGEP